MLNFAARLSRCDMGKLALLLFLVCVFGALVARAQTGPIVEPDGSRTYTEVEVKRISDELDRRADIIDAQAKKIRSLQIGNGCA